MPKNKTVYKNKTLRVVNSYNEWDPLEEAIVGILDGASIPPWHITLKATMPKRQHYFFQKFGGKAFPVEQIEAGKKELEDFVKLLESEGVKVRRPDRINFSKPYSTLDWKVSGGLYAAMPRDLLLVIGDEIIEAPMSWRSRYFEINAYRSLIKEYFLKGAKWTCAPKPQLKDDLYDYDYVEPKTVQKIKYAVTNFEPVFDAADFIRCGRDIFAQESNTTNAFGINWLKRHLGNKYRVHEIKFRDLHPMHIDATFMPLAPGKLLINEERIIDIPKMFKNWDVFYAPKPCISKNHILYMTSGWINMNVLMLDEKRVIIEKEEELMIKALKKWGFKPILCSFQNFNTFGGSFHCATLDIRRRGKLKSYF